MFDPKLWEQNLLRAIRMRQPRFPTGDYACPECGYETAALGGRYQGRFGVLHTLCCLDCNQAFDAPHRLYRYFVNAIVPDFSAPDRRSPEARERYGPHVCRWRDAVQERLREYEVGARQFGGPVGATIDVLGVHPIEAVTILRRPSLMAVLPHWKVVAQWLTLPGWVYQLNGEAGYNVLDAYVRFDLCPVDTDHVVVKWGRHMSCPACGWCSPENSTPDLGEETPPG